MTVRPTPTAVGASASSGDEAAAPRINWVLLATLMLGTFSGAMATTVLAPAFATIGAVFGVSVRDLAWVFTAYILTSVVAVPLMAKLSDLYGRKPIYLGCIGLFGLGSLGAAFAPTFELLLAARAIQALGGAGVSPVASAVIGDAFPRSRQGLALGISSTTWSIAGIAGPTIGGLVVQYLDWRWIFVLNLPIVVLTIGLGLVVLPRLPGRRAQGFDVPGLLLLSGALGATIYGVSQLDGRLPDLGVFEPARGGVLALGLALFVPWVMVERRVRRPFVDLRLLGRGQLAVAYALGMLGSTLMISRLYIPPMYESVLGADPQTAGLVTALSAGAVMAGTPLWGIAIDRYGSRLVLIAGGLLSAGGLLVAALITRDIVSMTAALLVSGVGLSAAIGAPLRYIIIGETGPADRGIANALLNLASSAGSAFAVAAAGAVVTSAATEADGWIAAYTVFGILALGTFALSFLVRPRSRPL